MPVWLGGRAILWGVGALWGLYTLNEIDDTVIDPITGGANNAPGIGLNTRTAGVLLLGASAALYLKAR